MPTLGISDEDCEGDGSYEGHEDLLFKRMQFKTVLPLEKMRSAAAHTLISRKLRESSAVVRHKESRYPNRNNEDPWKPSISTSVETLQHSTKAETDVIEEIANYYIKKALACSQKTHGDIVLNQENDGLLRSNFGTVLFALRSSQLVTLTNKKSAELQLPAFSFSGELPSTQRSNQSVAIGKQTHSLQTTMSKDVGSPATSSTNDKSFDFFGTPLATGYINDAISKMSQLDTYNGSRPSFGLGTLTSTPFTSIIKPVPTVNFNKNIETKIDKVGTVDHIVVSDKPKGGGTSAKSGPSTKSQEPIEKDFEFLSSLESLYMAEIKLAEEYDKAKKRVEENKDQKALRALTKRTIVEKVTVESKKTASLNEIANVSGFLCMLLNGKDVIGYGDKSLQLPQGDFRCYGFIITIESYMGVVERDPSLVVVISRILTLICGNVQQFESVLLGKIFKTSQLLSLNKEKCLAYARHLAAIEDRRFALIPETSIIKLFIQLHVTGSASQRTAHFTSKALWRAVTFVTEKSSRTIATAAILLELVESGSNHLKMVDPKKWFILLDKISNTLVPRLENEVDGDNFRRSVGEDAIVSSLRHAILRRRSLG